MRFFSVFFNCSIPYDTGLPLRQLVVHTNYGIMKRNTVNVEIFALHMFLRISHFFNIRENMYTIFLIFFPIFPRLHLLQALTPRFIHHEINFYDSLQSHAFSKREY